MANLRRLLAVDPSLTCTGWALFAFEGHGKPKEALLAVGTLKSLPPRIGLPARLLDLQQKIKLIFQSLRLGANDVLVCEAPTTMRDPRAAFKVEQVRGIFEALAREHGVDIPGRLNPRSVQYEVMGLRGKQLERKIVKETAVSIAKTLFAKELTHLGFNPEAPNLRRHQDVVDALLLGSLAASKLREGRWALADSDLSFAGKLARGGRRLPR